VNTVRSEHIVYTVYSEYTVYAGCIEYICLSALVDSALGVPLCVYICMHRRVTLRLYTYAFIDMWLHVCIRKHYKDVILFFCTYACIHMSLYVCERMHAQTCDFMPKCVCIHEHVTTCLYSGHVTVWLYTYACMDTSHLYVRMHAFTCDCMFVYVHRLVHTCLYTYAHIELWCKHK